MKGPGFFSMLQILAGMSMAAPMLVLGVDYLQTGQPLAGAAFLAFGVVALFAPSYVLRRIGGPRAWIRRRLPFGDGSDAADDDGRPSR